MHRRYTDGCKIKSTNITLNSKEFLFILFYSNHNTKFTNRADCTTVLLRYILFYCLVTKTVTIDFIF